MKRPDEVKSKSTKIVTSYNKPLTAIIVQQETILVLKFGRFAGETSDANLLLMT